MGSVRCVPFPRARATLRLAAQLTPTRRRRAPGTARSYLWNSREIEWSCPGGTQPAYLWQEFKPTSLDKITGKLTGGPGCMASVTFKGKRSLAPSTNARRKKGLTQTCDYTRDGGTVWWRSRAARRHLRMQLYVALDSGRLITAISLNLL